MKPQNNLDRKSNQLHQLTRILVLKAPEQKMKAPEQKMKERELKVKELVRKILVLKAPAPKTKAPAPKMKVLEMKVGVNLAIRTPEKM